MTLTDELKILDDKIKASQAQYDLSREAAKISMLSSKDLLEKYEYLTGEDLAHKQSEFEKAKFEYSSLGMCHLVKHLEKMKLKVLLRGRVILIMIGIILFTDFTKGMINLRRCHWILSTIG